MICKKCQILQTKDDFHKGKSQCKTCTKLWFEQNKESIAFRKKLKYDKNYINWYVKNRCKTDLGYKIAARLRSRLCNAIKSGSAVDNLGCSIEELKSHLESKFQPGMSWDNYGDWHIDHIIPLSKLNLKDPNDLQKACHFTNLQPLWAYQNWAKRDKLVG